MEGTGDALNHHHVKKRMWIDECFRHLKTLLDLDKIMNKKRVNMEKMVALTLLAYSIGLLIGEEIRSRVYSAAKQNQYSGLFILLKRSDAKIKRIWNHIMHSAFLLFRTIAFANVRNHV